MTSCVLAMHLRGISEPLGDAAAGSTPQRGEEVPGDNSCRQHVAACFLQASDA